MHSVFDYIFPHRCVNCSKIIHQKEMPLCLICYANLPFTHWEMDNKNLAYNLIRKTAAIEKGTSILIYKSGNAVQKLIMANKYFNQPHIGEFMAELAFPVVAKDQYDLILCVPSHPRTLRQRGYNQVERFSEELSKKMNIKFDKHLLKRTKRRDSQTHKNRDERYNSLANAFEISNDIIEYKNILLLDDVLTSGATISSCCLSILNKKDVKLSILTMAKVM